METFTIQCDKCKSTKIKIKTVDDSGWYDDGVNACCLNCGNIEFIQQDYYDNEKG